MPKLTNDGMLSIATGRNRKETNWRNKEMLWSDLVDRCADTHRTAETYAEYVSAKKPRQDEIKDIGGFVGGYLSSGRRKAENVLNRQLITLDLDYASTDLWDTLTMIYGGHACLLYSTHKHSKDTPRYRILMPLAEPVAADEYEAIARRIAGNIGIELFDPTTFQAERLMYWPSTSADGVYEFRSAEGTFIEGKDILNSYRDWTDTSEWPVSIKIDKIVRRSMQHQGDPLEKQGMVGAFCKTYTVAEAIDVFLSDVYDESDVENRYTFKQGSTSGGLIVYDDKYAYSHHGTDPISGKLCNAFDLVRLHKYGLKDHDIDLSTPVVKHPSYVAMVAFASQQEKVRQLIGEEKLAGARTDFSEFLAAEAKEAEKRGEIVIDDADDNSWLGKLDVNKKGEYYSTIDNILLILTHDPNLKGRIAYDQFEQREVALKNLPWRKITHQTRYLTDNDDAAIRHYIENTYQIAGAAKISDALLVYMMRNSFHPVRDYLNKLFWDGVPRLDTIFIDYMGAKDDDYTRAVTRKAFTGAVARIFRPGIKFDYMPVLVGAQGKKKSMLFDKLGRGWFSDSLSGIEGGSKTFEQLQGVWIIEFAELSAMRKSDVETVKHFITKREDRYRVAYGRRTENFPRQCVFFGTSNNKDFLKDPTGNRRFWPITILQELEKILLDVHIDLTDDIIGQIWAEACEAYEGGEKLYLDEEMENEATLRQKEHSEQDDRAGLIQQYLDTLLPENWDSLDSYERRLFINGDKLNEAGTIARERVCIAEIWCEALGGNQRDMSTYNTKALHAMMRNMPEWQEEHTPSGKKNFPIYGSQRSYIKTSHSSTRPLSRPLILSVDDEFL